METSILVETCLETSSEVLGLLLTTFLLLETSPVAPETSLLPETSPVATETLSGTYSTLETSLTSLKTSLVTLGTSLVLLVSYW